MDVGASWPFGSSPTHLSEKNRETSVGFFPVPRKKTRRWRGGSGEDHTFVIFLGVGGSCKRFSPTPMCSRSRTAGTERSPVTQRAFPLPWVRLSHLCRVTLWPLLPEASSRPSASWAWVLGGPGFTATGPVAGAEGERVPDSSR